jgi:hypothetical protein
MQLLPDEWPPLYGLPGEDHKMLTLLPKFAEHPLGLRVRLKKLGVIAPRF